MTKATKTLDEQIEERKQQAEKKGIFGKAYLVAAFLGKRTGNSDTILDVFNDTAASLVVRYFNDTLEYARDGLSVSVSLQGKKVFDAYAKEAHAVRTYIPGEWEKKLDALHLKAQQAVENEKAAKARKAVEVKAAYEREAAKRKQAEERAKRKNWGL